jgi:hypothetical protein
MKENKDEPKNEKKENKKPGPSDNNNKNQKISPLSISSNYMINAKKLNSRNKIERFSFIKDSIKQNQAGNSKKALNKTTDIGNCQNPIQKNIDYIKKLQKKNCLVANKNKNVNNNPKNNVRKSMFIMNKNKDNKIKIPEERRTLLLKKKNVIRINKEKTNILSEELLEKDDDKNININDNKENAEDINKDKKNKNDYKRAFSRKATERERQNKLNKLNKDSFGAIEKYKKKSTQFVKRENNYNNKNNLIKPKNNKIFRTKTNYNPVKNINMNNNKKPFQNKDGLKRGSINITFRRSNYNGIKPNINNKKNDKKEIKNSIKEKVYRNKIQTKDKNKLNKSMTKYNKNTDKKAKNNLTSKNEIKRRHTLSSILPIPKLTTGKCVVSLKNQSNKNIIRINKSNKIINKNNNKIDNKKLNKSFIQTKKIIKPKQKVDKNKNNVIKKNVKKDESESESSDEEDENDFDIYAMIRSKSCVKRDNNKKKNILFDNSDESEKKNSESEEGDDIESVLYGKQPKNLLMNIDNDDVEDKNSIVKCLDFDEIFLTSTSMFTENIEKNNLYNKYIQQFDEIFNKTILKRKEK